MLDRFVSVDKKLIDALGKGFPGCWTWQVCRLEAADVTQGLHKRMQ